MRASSMAAVLGLTAAMVMGGRAARAEEPPAPAPDPPAKPRPMVTTADELFPDAQDAPSEPRSAAPRAKAAKVTAPLVIPPSLLIKRPGLAKAPYGKGPSATPPVESVATRAANERAGYGDANATSNFFAPTAIMPPAGSVAFHSYELLVLGMSYSPSSIFSMSAQTLVPLDDSAAFIGLFSAKLQLHRSEAVRLALHGSAVYLDDDDAATYALVGGVATFCFEPVCDSHFSGYAGVGVGEQDDVGVPLVLSGGFVGALGKSVKALVEVDVGTVMDGNSSDGAALAIYGLRLGSQTFALDAGFAKPIGEDDGDLFPLGFPVVNFSIRP